MDEMDKIQKGPNGIVIFLALFPLTGMLGIHDFILGRKKDGIKHLALWVVPVTLFTCYNINHHVGWFYLLFFTTPYLALVSYIWAIFEIFSLFKNKQTVQQDKVKKNTNPLVIFGTAVALVIAFFLFWRLVYFFIGY